MPMSALSLAPPVQRVRIRIEPEQRFVFLTVSGAATGQEVSEALVALYTDHPQVAGFDMLFDIREYSGDVEAEHVKPIAAAYAANDPDPAGGGRTAFVTFDPNFELWAASMDFLFPGRTHHVFSEIEEACAFLRPAGA